MDKITVYTDGSALNNGSPDSGCGWACKLIYRGRELMKSGSDKGKTNNFMEMTAVLQAMRAITDKSIPVEVFSDSRYVVETLNGNFKIKKNVELWQELMAEKEKFADIKFVWVKGHDISKHNNEVDRQAVAEARKRG
ncbi:MAG: ribonuclease HI [Lachnospiraceae bacterium]|nr:ribonuclease HI [Lachnospiraceae bacterium]